MQYSDGIEDLEDGISQTTRGRNQDSQESGSLLRTTLSSIEKQLEEYNKYGIFGIACSPDTYNHCVRMREEFIPGTVWYSLPVAVGVNLPPGYVQIFTSYNEWEKYLLSL